MCSSAVFATDIFVKMINLNIKQVVKDLIMNHINVSIDMILNIYNLY